MGVIYLVRILHNQPVITPEGNRVEVTHQRDCCGPFWDFCSGCFLREAYTYPRELSNPADSLETIYRENNAVEGWEVNVSRQARSLSVGDVVVIHEMNDPVPVGAWKVASLGFEQVDISEVSQALANPLPEGAIFA